MAFCREIVSRSCHFRIAWALLLAAAALCPLDAKATAPEVEWARGWGGTGNDNAQAVRTDTAGNVYTAGYFSDSVDFNPGDGTFNIASAGSFDVFISKLDADGVFLWSKRIGGTGLDIAYDLALDNLGNCYITGWFEGAVDFDPGPGTFELTSNGLADVFICKLDSDGGVVWAEALGGTGDDRGRGIAIDVNNSVFVTGWFSESAEATLHPLAEGISSLGGDDVFVGKLDDEGQFVWLRSLGHEETDRGYAIDTDGNGGVYIAGAFRESVDFDPGDGVAVLASAGAEDTFALKLDDSGNYNWAKNLGGTGNDPAYGIRADATGAVYITGAFQSIADFNPGSGTFTLESNGNYDAYVANLAPSGEFSWALSIGGTEDDNGRSIVLDPSGNVYAVGWFSGEPSVEPGSGNPGIVSAGDSDVYACRIDPTGNLVWLKSVGGGFTDLGYGIDRTPEGTVLITGLYRTLAEFDDIEIAGAGDNDIFVSKLIQPENSGNGGALIVDTLADENNGDTSSIDALIATPGGAGISLREAIIAANNTGGEKSITFNVEGTISPTGTALPALTSGSTTIDGGTAGTIILDGAALDLDSGTGAGLVITSADNTLRAMRIQQFHNEGIIIAGIAATGNTVSGCVIGANGDGNGGNGILVFSGASNNTIGGTDSADRNVIGANAQNGIYIDAGSTGNTIAGNYIGTDGSGTLSISNSKNGVHTFGSGNFIGPGNLISGNTVGGVLIQECNGNHVFGNTIGLNAAGTAALGNGTGVRIFASFGNIIGGDDPAERNIISGNFVPGDNGDGVRIASGAEGNSVIGNYIGVNAAGDAAVPNTRFGVDIDGGAFDNIVRDNVISGNGSTGLNLRFTGTTGNTVAGNRIGIAAESSTALPNGHFGVAIFGAAQANTVGGDRAADRNIISGNTTGGVSISGVDTSGNIIKGNYIGTNDTGTDDVPNTGDGITLKTKAAGNRIESNWISGNEDYGVIADDSSDNFVTGNRIGLDASGNTAIPNGLHGVLLVAGAAGNSIGGTTTGERNIISGNGGQGIALSGAGTTGNTIAGNYIGTNANGTAKVPNTVNGVAISQDADGNTIGGSATGSGNVISGNTGVGVWLDGSPGDGNVIAGNRIGTNAAGSAALGNGLNGIAVSMCDDTEVLNNLISGNSSSGISGSVSNGTIIRGNRIGTNAAGTGVIPNEAGIRLLTNAVGTLIGGPGPDDGNTVAGNTEGQINLISSDIGTIMQGNRIGVLADGSTAPGNSPFGVKVSGTSGALIGADAESPGNIIGGNDIGVWLTGAATGNTIRGNIIGYDEVSDQGAANLQNGIQIDGDANLNVIGNPAGQAGACSAVPAAPLLDPFANIIANNAGTGVLVSGASTVQNRIRENRFANNLGGDIALSGGANAGRTAPAILALGALPNSTSERVSVSIPDGLLNTIVDFYLAPINEQGARTGALFLKSCALPASTTINFESDLGVYEGTHAITATYTDANGNTAPFGTATPIFPDNNPPVLDLTGVLPIPPHECGTEFIPTQATATDNVSGVAEIDVDVSQLNEDEPGQYPITYFAEDTLGNRAEQEVEVTVQDTVPPVITLIGDAVYSYPCYAVYEDPGATAFDQCAGALAVDVDDDDVDTTTPDEYTVTYTADDGVNPPVTATRTVVIECTDLYVSFNDGTDDNASGRGTEELPWKTIGFAMERAEVFSSLGQVTIHLAPGIYPERVELAENVRLLGDSGDRTDTVIQPGVEAIGSGSIVVRGAADAGLSSLSIAAPPTAPAGLVLLEIANVAMRVENVVLDGNLRQGSTGIDVTGPASSDALIRRCQFKNLGTGIAATNSAVPLSDNSFENIAANSSASRAIAIGFTAKGEAALTPVLGARGRILETGFNRFRGLAAGARAIEFTNVPAGVTSAQYNDWGVYTEEQILARISVPLKGAGGAVNVSPFIPEAKAIVAGSVVGLVLEGPGALPIALSAQPAGRIGVQTAAADANGLFVFPALSAGQYSLSAQALGYQSAAPRLVLVNSGITEAPRFLLTSDGTTEGEGEGEGTSDGEAEAEGTTEGEGEGTTVLAQDILEQFQSLANPSGNITLAALQSAFPGFTQDDLELLDYNEDGQLQAYELIQASGGDSPLHRADINGDGTADLSEVLRAIQLYNVPGYHCALGTSGSEDGYALGYIPALQNCVAHALDYNQQDWRMSLSELLRLIQFYNVGGIEACPGTGEDDYCPAAP